jgi:hypothetical protein
MEGALLEDAGIGDAQPARLECLSHNASWTIIAMPATASQTQHMVMLLFSEAILAKRIEPITTTGKITLVVQLGMEGIPLSASSRRGLLRQFRQHGSLSRGARLSELLLCAAQQHMDEMDSGSAVESILLNCIHGK